MNNSYSQSKFFKISLVVAIIIVVNLFFNYSLSFIYNEPSHEDYVKTTQVVKNINNQEECVATGGQWNDYDATYAPKSVDGTTVLKGYCDVFYTSNLEYQAAVKIYDRNVFIALVILGIISIVVGAFVTVSIIPVAFSWAGVLSLIIASMRYWTSADKLLKVIILACALGALIWVAIKKLDNHK